MANGLHMTALDVGVIDSAKLLGGAVMFERLSIWFQRDHASVTVSSDGARRDTSADTMVKVLDAMQDDDRAMLVRWCQAVVEWAAGDVKRLRDW